MRKFNLGHSGVNAVELISYIDFLICAEESELSCSYSDEEYLERFYKHLRIMSSR